MQSNGKGHGRHSRFGDIRSPFIDSELGRTDDESGAFGSLESAHESPFVNSFVGGGDEPANEGETVDESLFDPAQLRSHEELPADEESAWTGASDFEAEGSEYESYAPFTDGEADEPQSELDAWTPSSEPESWGDETEAGEIVQMEDEDESAGQIVQLRSEAESEVEEEWEAAHTQNTGPLRARILWPALGFPAVISPRRQSTGTPFTTGDATRCVCLLILSNRKFLGKEDVAKYLRFVPWHDRGKRHIADGATGSFAASDIEVRNDAPASGTVPRLSMAAKKDRLSGAVAFGGDASGENVIAVSLANRVREFYRGQGLAYLHEIRVTESASARLADGSYQLFWNNEHAGEDAPSDEMALLLEKFAKPRRAKLMASWKQQAKFLLDEYEYEYGSLHAPYGPSNPRKRAELLHPLFVQTRPVTRLRIGHLTDLHVNTRDDVYERNLSRPDPKEDPKIPKTPIKFNNWNRASMKLYAEAQRDSDVLLLTGDLIDYGRGYWGTSEPDKLGQDAYYQPDRNWFLFSYLISSGERYGRPSYTILGNHDWRLNPYPPFATGAPSPEAMIDNYPSFTDEQQKAILRKMHRAGHERGFSYSAKAETAFQLLREKTGQALAAVLRMAGGTKQLDVAGTPAETTVESVLWYLLFINPFLDYSFTLPGGHKVLMLDWGENENLLFPITQYGKNYKYNPFAPGEASGPGPKASDSLSPLQQWHVQEFASDPGAAKVIGIHAPPIGPYTDWFDLDLFAGRKVYAKGETPRGPTNYALKRPDGTIEKWNGHPLFAIRPSGGAEGMTADYNSFEKWRPEFLKRVADPKTGIRLVLSGHIHRGGFYTTRVGAKAEGAGVAGQMLVRATSSAAIKSARPPAVSNDAGTTGKAGPLYVNTTSAGPRGHSWPARGSSFYIDSGYAHVELERDGTIVSAEFRPKVQAAQQVVATPVRREVEVGV